MNKYLILSAVYLPQHATPWLPAYTKEQSSNPTSSMAVNSHTYVKSSLIYLLTSAWFATAIATPLTGQVVLGGNFDTQGDDDLSKIISGSPLLSFHRDLVEAQSVTNDENSVGSFIVDYLQQRGFLVGKQPVDSPDSTKPPRFNVLALLPDATPGTHIRALVTSHIDTVPPFISYNLSYPTDTDSTQSFKRDKILISGRGSVDAKASVATQIHAVLELLANKTISGNDVALLFVVGEEYDGLGMRTFSNSGHNGGEYEAVIFGEPTELKLATGHKGIMMAKITAKGLAAHSGYPWLGKSANSMMIPVLSIMDQLGNTPEEKGGLPSSEKYGNTTVNLGLLRGGVAGNVVPEEATLETTCRLAGGTAEQAREIVRKAIEPLGDGYEVTFSTQGYGPVDVDADVEGFDRITVNYGTDVPNLKLNGSPKRYLYGPGSILVAHGPNEAITVGDLEAALDGYKKLITHSLG